MAANGELEYVYIVRRPAAKYKQHAAALIASHFRIECRRYLSAPSHCLCTVLIEDTLMPWPFTVSLPVDLLWPARSIVETEIASSDHDERLLWPR
jgi:hypothetical protein